MMQAYTKASQASLEAARKICDEVGSQQIKAIHLLYGLYLEAGQPVQGLLDKHFPERKQVEAYIKADPESGQRSLALREDAYQYDQESRRALMEADKLRIASAEEDIAPIHILYGLLQADTGLKEVLEVL